MTLPSLPDLLRMLAELFDAAWDVRGFFEAFTAAGGYLQFGLALRALAALFLVGCTLACSLRLTRWLVPHAGLPFRWSALFCVGMWVSTIGFTILRELRAFKLGWALLACAALLAAAIKLRPEVAPLAWAVRRELRAVRLVCKRIHHGRYVVLWSLLFGFAAVLTLRSLIIPPLGWDTITYHGPRAAQFVQTGKFTFDDGIVSFNFYRHFFAGGEVLTAWSMLPFHSDLFANLASCVQWLGIGLSGWAVARAVGLREPFASTSACLVMFMPTLQLEVGAGYVELALNTGLFTGIAAALICLRRPHLGTALVCALALGVAAGIKLPGAPPGVVVAAVLWIRLLAARSLPIRAKLATLGASLVLAILPALPWMVRAMRDTGYPLSPLPARLFGWTLGVASHAMRFYGHRPQLQPYTWEAEKESLLLVFSPLSKLNETLGSMTLIPLLVLPIGFVALLRRRPWAAIALAAAALVPVLAHYSEGMTPVRLLRAQSSSRFLVPTFALILPMSLAWCRRGNPLATAYRWLLLAYPLTYSVLCLRRGWSDWEHREMVVVALALALLLGVTLSVQRRGLGWAAGAFLVGWMIFCSGLQLRRDETRGSALARSHALHNMPRWWVDGVQFVDDQAQPRTIAITSGPDRSADKWFYYFYLGSRLQNRVRYITPSADGQLAHPGWKGDLEQRANKDTWNTRLDQAGISEVLTFPPRSLEQGWMEEHPDRFEKLAGKEDWGLFRIRR